MVSAVAHERSGSRPLITVFTPAFNRAPTLPRLAESLDAQRFQDFEWLVVDDGSTDGSPALLDAWAAAGEHRLRFVRGPNGGKHRAINRGVSMAGGEWFFIVDSDDWLPADALETIAGALPEAAKRGDCGGLIGLRGDGPGRVIGTRLPSQPRYQTTIDLYFLRGVKGDKAVVYRTAVLKDFPFPEFQGEKFLTEAVVWNRIARSGLKMLVVDEIIYGCEYLDGGLSSRSLELRAANPAGNLLYYAEQLELPLPLRRLVRPAINYLRFAMLCRKGALAALRAIGRGRALCLVLLPIAAVLALRDAAVLGRRR
jgi:glycosyltransferase involved in cell wall biosynthesis